MIPLSEDNIHISCTECGGAIKFPDGDHSVRCPFCSRVLLITAPNRVLKFYLNTNLESNGIKFITEGHCKRSGIPLPTSVEDPLLFYLPFWRFRGMRYRLSAQAQTYEFEDGTKLETTPKISINSTPFDLNFPGIDLPSMSDVFLGVRAQTVGLCPEVPERIRGLAEVINPEIMLDQAREMAYQKAGMLNECGRLLIDEIIGEKLTLIYFPIWVSRFTSRSGKYYLLLDGVSGKEFCRKDGEFNGVKHHDGFESVTSIRIVSHHCPECGADLPAGGDTVVFPCNNCGRAWYLEGNELIRNEVFVAESIPDAYRYYPFWGFEAIFNDHEGILTYQQAKELFANKLSLLIDEAADSSFRFYIPAFGMRNPENVWKLSVNLTRSQPDLKLYQDSINNLAACSLPQEEAGELARVLWFFLIFSSPKGRLWRSHDLEDVPGIHLRPGKLIYIPMREEGLFLREMITGTAIATKGVI